MAAPIFLLKDPVNVSNETGEQSDYYYFRFVTTPLSGKTMLVKLEGKFYVARIAASRDKVEMRFGRDVVKRIDPRQVTFLGVLVGTYRNVD